MYGGSNIRFQVDGADVTLADLITRNYDKGSEQLTELVCKVVALEPGGFCFHGPSLVVRVIPPPTAIVKRLSKESKYQHLAG